MMSFQTPQPTRSELATAVVGAIVWSLAGMALAIQFASPACADLMPALQWKRSNGDNAAVCRVHNYLPNGAANVGSGTLIDVTANRQRGLVLSCAHLFTEGTGRVVVEFPDGRTHGALVVASDGEADLAALEIANPVAAPTPVSLQVESAATLRACGFGPSGDYRCVAGRVLGYSTGAGQESLRMAGAVRSGDSGGGVFDGQGRLVAVVWGESGGVTYASTGRPLARFLDRVLGERARGVGVAARPANGAAVCPDGRCPLAGGESVGAAPAGRGPAAGGGLNAQPTAPARGCDCGAALAAIGARLDGLERAGPVRDGEGDSPSTLGGAGRAAGLLATTLLGISGPAGWGIIAASTVGGWLVGRRLKKRRLRATTGSDSLATRDSPLATPSEATAAAESAFPIAVGSAASIDQRQPIERDDRETRELLRLSQLEGRDPLQDAVAGRLALDRLDAAAESDVDPQRAGWADELRRELRERFNEIAPTKFEIANAEC